MRTIKLTENTVNLMLNLLDNRPHKEVRGLFDLIRAECASPELNGPEGPPVKKPVALPSVTELHHPVGKGEKKAARRGKCKKSSHSPSE